MQIRKRRSKADCLGQPMFGKAARAGRFQIGMQNIGPGNGFGRFIGINPAVP